METLRLPLPERFHALVGYGVQFPTLPYHGFRMKFSEPVPIYQIPIDRLPVLRQGAKLQIRPCTEPQTMQLHVSRFHATLIRWPFPQPSTYVEMPL
jgi:hypothetical protein